MTSARRCRAVRSSEQGAVAVLVALLMVALLGFGALVIDIGRLYRVRSELQNSSDAAALAGAIELDNTADGINAARLAAQEWALKNTAHNDTVSIPDEDIIFGHWNESEQTFTPIAAFPPDPTAINALQVTSRRDSTQGNSISLTLARLIGHSEADVTAEAVAVGGGPAEVECGFPLVVSECSLEEPVNSGTCEYCMLMQDNNSDTAGWTSFSEQGQVGNPAIRAAIASACLDADGNPAVDETTGECTGLCNSTTTSGDTIQVKNGNMLNSGNNSFCTLIQDILNRNGTPQTFTVTVPVLDHECPGGLDFSSAQSISGFATMDIHGIQCGNNGQMVLDTSADVSCEPSNSGDVVVASLRCDLENTDSPAGGGFHGLPAKHMRLVR